MNSPYVPERGDLVWLDLNPRVGREQAGHRPALVVSESAYNERAGLALVCPITNQQKGYPFEVPIPDGLPVSGVVLADHVRSVDYSVRRMRRAGTASSNVIADVVAKLRAMVES